MIRRDTVFFGTAFFGAFCAVHSAFAQPVSDAAVKQSPQTPVKRPIIAPPHRVEEPTLLETLPQTTWDISTNGPLLIVSPEEVRPYHELVNGVGGYVILNEPPFPRNAAGKYNPEDIAAYYDRKIVRLKSLAVFAPRTMTLLNDSHLPKPSAFAGLSSSEKLRLLESTFTDAQWRVASSDTGIGLGDLTEKQQDLYLSLLPEPFIMARLSDNPADASKGLGYDSFSSFSTGGGSGSSSVPQRALAPGGSVTLTVSQRDAVRLQLAKKLDWYLVYTNGSALSAGTADHAPDTAYNYQLTSSGSSRSAAGGVYGGNLKIVDENQLKPSQLPAKWDALDVRIDLHASKTVGELIAQIAATTRVKLHCDPRYADRKFEAIGESARASDVLKALNWALTSTWRRLGDDFVLTDDLVGLGTREARIDDWLQQNAFLALQLKAQVAKALQENQYRSVGWSATDPLRPNDTLIAKIDDYAARQDAQDVSASSRLLIPVTDLSPAGQELFHQQAVYLSSKAKEHSDNPVLQRMNEMYSRPLRYDVVQAGVRVQTSFIVPGIGKTDASTSSGNRTNPDILNKARPQPADATRAAWSLTKATTFDGAPQARALLVTPKSAAELGDMVKEAHDRGFTQLWVDTPQADSSLLTAAVQAGIALKMTVYASVPLLRAASGSAPTDRNILGETVAQTLRRRNGELRSLLAPDEEIAPPKSVFESNSLTRWAQGDRGQSVMRNGEYRPLTPESTSAVVIAVSKLAATSGLAGIALRDEVAPSFGNPTAQSGTVDYRSQNYDPVVQMGYTPDLRLACLQKYGFDPIDLSPLPNGDRLDIPFEMQVASGSRDMALPLFRDFGTSASNLTYNGQQGGTIGAKQSWTQWCQFRSEQSASFLRAVREAIAAQHPNLPLMIRKYDNPFDRPTNWYSSAEPPMTLAVPIPDEKNPPVSNRKTDLERARAESRVNYFAVGTPLNRVGYDVGASAGWDGVVVDLGDVPASEVLDVLRTFPPVGSH